MKHSSVVQGSLVSALLPGSVQLGILYISHNSDFFPITINEIFYCRSHGPVISLIIATSNEELKKTNIRRHDITTRNSADKALVEWQLYTTMKRLEQELLPLNFCRIHHSYLVNMMHVQRFSGGKMSCVSLTNGELLPVSVAGKAAIKKIIRGDHRL